MRKTGIYLLIFNLLIATFPPQALAGLIQTPDAITAGERGNSMGQINDFLAREEVREQFLELGVDPANVEERLAALTDAEISQLQQQLNTLPAGGDGILVVIGVVFVVLLILELVGVTNIFNKI